MKATIDVPEDLYRKVKAKTVLQGRAVQDVTIELFQKWIDEPFAVAEDSVKASKGWAKNFLSFAISEDTPGSCVREILEQDRTR